MNAWPIVALDDVAKIDRESIGAHLITDGTTYVGLENIEPGGKLVGVAQVTNGELASTKFCFTHRHVLYGKLRPYLAKIARPDFQGVCSTDILPILPSPSLSRDYLLHFLRQPRMVTWANSQSTGANLPRLGAPALASMPILVPPIDEQRRIAAVLDHADALRERRREAIAKLDDLDRSIFLDIFGDPGANPKGWPRVEFGTLLDSIDSGKSPKCYDRAASPEEWGVLKLGAVTKCQYDASQNKALPAGVIADPRHEVREGDVLFSRKNTRDLVAACAYVRSTPPRMLLPDLIFRLRLKASSEVDPVFLQALLTQPRKRRKIQALAGGSAASMPNISKTRLLTVMIECPPLAVQREFARRVEAIERLKESQRAHLAELDALFASLQSRAFQGQLWDNGLMRAEVRS